MGRAKTAVFYSRNSSTYKSKAVLLMILYSLNRVSICKTFHWIPGKFFYTLVDRTHVEHKQKQCASTLAFGDRNTLLSKFHADISHTVTLGGINSIPYG